MKAPRQVDPHHSPMRSVLLSKSPRDVRPHGCPISDQHINCKCGSMGGCELNDRCRQAEKHDKDRSDPGPPE